MHCCLAYYANTPAFIAAVDAVAIVNPYMHQQIVALATLETSDDLQYAQKVM